MSIEVILKEHVEHLGRRGEIVKVADGYARNFLFPRKLALAVTSENKKQIEREKAKAEARDAEELTQAHGAADAARGRRTGHRPPRRRARHALRLGHLGRHRRGAGGQGADHRSPQDPARRSAEVARRPRRAGQAAPRRHGATSGSRSKPPPRNGANRGIMSRHGSHPAAQSRSREVRAGCDPH